jgi:ribosomal protein S18 acetylase RimI-like enzyme
MCPPISFRSATAADAESLIDLMVISSWGAIRDAWQLSSRPGEGWRDRARAEVSDAQCEIGYSRFVIAEVDGEIAGMILLNAMGSTDMLSEHGAPPEHASAIYLMKECRHSLFVRELAVHAWARGRGLAQSFLDLAERVAFDNGSGRVTLIVNDANSGAHRLYHKNGFRQVAEAPSIGHPKFADGSMLLLLEKTVQSP